jgi:chemotaxis protein methyltransferase CheR
LRAQAGKEAPFTSAAMRRACEVAGLAQDTDVYRALEVRLGALTSNSSTLGTGRFPRAFGAGGPESDDLVTALTVGETYFFREPEQFDYIRSRVFSRLHGRSSDAPIRVWSAGCASGEEAYSLAIVLREAGLGSTSTVLGTDISRHRLDKAINGSYLDWSLRGVSEERVARYFRRRGESFELADVVREAVTFRVLNLAAPVYPSIASGAWGMDLIMCRNVLIYMDPTTTEAVARRLLDALRPEGLLFLGASDPPLADLMSCKVVMTGAGVAYRRANRTVVPGSAFGGEVDKGSAAPGDGGDRAAGGTAPRASSREVTAAYDRGDFAFAARLASEAAADDPGDPSSWIVWVRSLAKQGAAVAAGRICENALQHHRLSSELTYLRGTVLASVGRHEKAASAARVALYLDRRMVVAHLLLGRVLVGAGDTAGAIRALRNAERILSQLPTGSVVAGSEGERADQLLAGVRLQLALLEPVS